MQLKSDSAYHSAFPWTTEYWRLLVSGKKRIPAKGRWARIRIIISQTVRIGIQLDKTSVVRDGKWRVDIFLPRDQDRFLHRLRSVGVGKCNHAGRTSIIFSRCRIPTSVLCTEIPDTRHYEQCVLNLFSIQRSVNGIFLAKSGSWNLPSSRLITMLSISTFSSVFPSSILSLMRLLNFSLPKPFRKLPDARVAGTKTYRLCSLPRQKERVPSLRCMEWKCKCSRDRASPVNKYPVPNTTRSRSTSPVA